jgi:hypothetical protein
MRKTLILLRLSLRTGSGRPSKVFTQWLHLLVVDGLFALFPFLPAKIWKPTIAE